MSLEFSPTVVDSPIPSTPVDPSPIDNDSSESGALADDNAESEDTHDASVSDSGERDWAKDLSEQFGTDVSGFSSEKDALSAVRMLAEDYAKRGLTQPSNSSINYETVDQNSSQDTSDDLGVDFDDADLDPKIASAFKTLQSNYQKLVQQQKDTEERFRQTQAEQVKSQWNQVWERANSAIDKLASPKYGVGGNRTALQMIATNNIRQLTESIISGMAQSGKQLPTIEKLVSMAVMLDGGELPKKASPKANAPVPPDQRGVRPQIQSSSSSKVVDPSDPLGLRNDPKYRQAIRHILNSSN